MLTFIRHLVAAAALPIACCANPDQPPGPTSIGGDNAASVPANVSSVTRQNPLLPVPKDAGAGQAGQDDYTWTFARSSGGSGFPVVMYGARASDELVINLQCRTPGTVTLLVLRADTDSPLGRPIRLRTGETERTLPATVGQPSGDGNVPITATIAADDPFLTKFRSTGKLSLVHNDHAITADAIDDKERATIQRFFLECARQH